MDGHLQPGRLARGQADAPRHEPLYASHARCTGRGGAVLREAGGRRADTHAQGGGPLGGVGLGELGSRR
jgi:hypothetical protein